MWIVPEADRVLTPNRFDPPHRRIQPIDFGVLHYTASSFGSALAWFKTPKAVSAHFLIDRKGRVVQLASLESRTWHADSPTGSDRWRGKPVDANSRSLGIELENFGFLEKVGPFWAQRMRPDSPPVVRAAIKDADVLIQNEVAWQRYTEPQIVATLRLVVRLSELFPILVQEDDRWVGHEDIDPGRKHDPGPAAAELWARLRGLIEKMRAGSTPVV